MKKMPRTVWSNPEKPYKNLRKRRKQGRKEGKVGNKRDHASSQSLIIQNRGLKQFWILICFYFPPWFLFSLPPFTYTAGFMFAASREILSRIAILLFPDTRAIKESRAWGQRKSRRRNVEREKGIDLPVVEFFRAGGPSKSVFWVSSLLVCKVGRP